MFPNPYSKLFTCLFNSHVIYACQILGQHKDIIKISAIKHKAIRNINFKPKNYPAGNLHQSNKIKGLYQIDKFYVCRKCSRKQSPKNIYRCI